MFDQIFSNRSKLTSNNKIITILIHIPIKNLVNKLYKIIDQL